MRFVRLIKKICGFLLALSCLGLGSVAVHADRGDPTNSVRQYIVVGGDHYHPPYEFLDDSGAPAGYNVELTRAIAEVMGVDVRFVFGEWADMRRKLESGEVDILQGMSYSEERAKTFDFAPPHAIVHQSFFARKGAPAARLDELKGKEVIVQRLDIMHDYLLEHNVGAELITVDTHADALRLLASGKGDYALVANLPSLYLSRQLGLTNILPVAKPFANRYGYAVKKGDTNTLATFSEGLAILKNTGRHQEIYDKWLGPLEDVGSFPWKKVGQIGAGFSGALLLVLGGIVMWNRMLRREVESRSADLRRHQQQLIQADKMTSLGVLVSGVAHEINNPSSLLLLNLPVLRDAYEDSREILENHYRAHGDFTIGGLAYSRMRDEIPYMMDEMLEGARRIKRIVGDLKDFARQGTADLSEAVDLNTVVDTAIRLVDNSIRKATFHFEVSLGIGLPLVRGNSQRIEQVVINLILNACQALRSPTEGIFMRTYYDADESGEQRVILEVRDQGRGIDADAINQLTDPFFTTRRESGGTGLGLSVSAGIVSEHRGRLVFDSKPGEGTTVRMILPVQGDHPLASEASKPVKDDL
ncbi:putative two-component sensor [Marinobacterium lacunae]|uniref:histidine kinase n=1 Tax=Marinobacterium lacunae TaxID=1232683 RepID=A0A081G030_9GAMM|nr:transporter substrate-binding domain-containing protein [Marinobacterium lacunae]KEA64135.1 putative two-component sensor [Marinobacterium lacunae]